MTYKKLGGLLTKNCTFHKLLFFKKSVLFLPWPQRFEKIFAHKSKYQKTSQNTSIDN